jgi:hypothetical protein
VETETKILPSEEVILVPLDICPEYLFQKTPIIILKERTLQPGDAFEDTALKPGIEVVKF